jgi:hypothetical protein
MADRVGISDLSVGAQIDSRATPLLDTPSALVDATERFDTPAILEKSA